MTAVDVVASDSTAIALQMYEKYKVTCPVLSQELEVDEPPFKPNDTSIVIPVTVRFTGHADLFKTSGGSSPVIQDPVTINRDSLVIQFRVEPRHIAQLEGQARALIGRIKAQGLDVIAAALPRFNESLKGTATQRIDERKHELSKHDQMLGALKGSGLTIRRRDDGTEEVIVPVKQKEIAITKQPSASSAAAVGPEPELAMKDYDEILGVIGSMVKVFERSPSVFKGMEEEALRTILLVGLNGLFEGAATGETFNGAGKTDILIRVQDKNVFIAECLIWKGPEAFRKKFTEQLSRYATWRDTKMAMIVFNRNRDFTSVVSKMKEEGRTFPGFISEIAASDSTIRLKLRREDDAKKHFILTCLAFEVPA
jgi:hypothetical protein